jgi:hypothetical protein
MRGESRPDDALEIRVHERHTHFEAVCHRHRIDVAQQLPPQKAPGLQPRNRGQRPFSAAG